MNPRIYLLALGTFALGTDAFVMAGVLPAIAHDFKISVDTAGLLVAVFSLTYGLGAPFLAALTAAIPRHQLLIGALIVFTLANLLSALSPFFWLLLLSRIIAGGAAALYSPTAYAFATSLAPANRRGQALAIVAGGLSSSTVLGVPLGAWVGQHFNWSVTFGLVVALAGLAVSVLVVVGLPKIEQGPAISLRTRLAPIVQPRVLLALLPTFLWSVAGYVVYTYIAPLLQQKTGVFDVGGLLLVYGLGGVVGSSLGGWSVDRFGSLRPMIASLITQTLALALLPLTAGNLILVGLNLFVWGVAGWASFPAQQNRLMLLSPASPGLVLALNNSALYLGIAAGSGLGGLLLASSVPVEILGWIGSLIALAALTVLLGSQRTLAARQEQAVGGV